MNGKYIYNIISNKYIIMQKKDKVINKIFYYKLTAARDMTRLSQQEIAQFTGLSQPRISRIERGEGVFVPNNYLVLLWQKAINLNDLFDDNISVEEFRAKFQDRHPTGTIWNVACVKGNQRF